MKLTKRFLSLLLCLCMVLPILPVLRTQALEYGDLEYKIINNQVTITDCAYDATGAITIPSEIDGYPVTAIGTDAFLLCRNITSVSIPDSVTEIGEDAFRKCFGLHTLSLGRGISTLDVMDLEESPIVRLKLASNHPYLSLDSRGVLLNKDKTRVIYAPRNISGSYTAPKTVQIFGDSSFRGCASLTEVIFPDSVTTIGENAFEECENLRTVIFGNKLDYIGKYAFFECPGVTDLTIPASVTCVEDSAFGMMDHLDTITFQGSAPSIGRAFYKTYVTLLYPEGDETWEPKTEQDLCGNYYAYSRNGKVTWRTYQKGAAAALIEVDKEQKYFKDGVLSNFTGLIKDDNRWLYIDKGQLNLNYTGMVRHGGSWWYVIDGIMAHNTTSLVKWNYAWWYVKNGKVAANTTAIVSWNNSLWYVKNGKVASNVTSLIKYNNRWYYVLEGKVATGTTTLVKYGGQWWSVVNGLVSYEPNLIKYNGTWWYVKNGHPCSATTMFKWNGAWYYVVDGKVASNTTSLVKYNNEWWYVVKGKIASATTTLVKYNGSWYYVKNGKVASATTTLTKYNGSWYYVKNGMVDGTYTGLFAFGGRTYYVKKGVAQTTTSGKISVNGKTRYVYKGALTDCHTHGHSYKKATCTANKYCTKCTYVAAPPLGHSWKGILCTRCGLINTANFAYGGSHNIIDGWGYTLEGGTYKSFYNLDQPISTYYAYTWKVVSGKDCVILEGQQGVCTIKGKKLGTAVIEARLDYTIMEDNFRHVTLTRTFAVTVTAPGSGSGGGGSSVCPICHGAGYTDCYQCDKSDSHLCTNPLCNGGIEDCPMCS